MKEQAMSATFSRTTRFLDGERHGRRLIALLLAAVIAGWGVWFVFGRVACHETTAKARLEVSSAAHPIAAPVGGQIIETRLTIGRSVQAGEVLLVLDAEAEQRTLKERQTRYHALAARLAAVRKEIAAEEQAIRESHKAQRLAMEETQAQVAAAAARLAFAEQQAAVTARLRNQRAASDEEYRRAQVELEAQQASLKALEHGHGRQEQDRAVQESDRKTRLAKLAREVADIESERAGEEAGIARLEYEVERRTIRAPVSGQIGEVAAEFQVGSVVSSSARLGAIIPPGMPRAVAYFSPAAVGRVRPGQPARLRLAAFPWAQYGSLAATVTQVGNETTDGQIRVELSLDPAQTSAIPLGHGLPALVEIEVERISPAVLALRTGGELLATQPKVVTE
jgi:multidrug resistance efflux pump